MSTKEIVEFETRDLSSGNRDVLHLHHEGSFFRAYEWSAFLACRYLHDFKVTKRVFKGIEEPVAYIGFLETSLKKWVPEGAEQNLESEKHLSFRLPKELFGDDTPEVMDASFHEWKDAVPLAESQARREKKAKNRTDFELGTGKEAGITLTSVMQRILSYPIESRSPLESMAFLAEVKRQLSTLI